MKPFKMTAFATLGSVVALLFSASNASAALVAYENFDYDSSDGTLTAQTDNNGTGWANAWDSLGGGVSGITVSGTNQSLFFDQSPDLITDGSSHVFSTSNRGNTRLLTSGVAVSSSNSLYASILIRSFGPTGDGARMRLEFANSGNTAQVRANVGIDQGTLYAADRGGFTSASNHTFLNNAFLHDTTYLLVMKRTNDAIFASLILADGNQSTLDMEPTWQIEHLGTTGLTFDHISLIMNGTDTGLRADELRLATTWDGAVTGIVIPEPGTYAVIMSLLCGALVFYRRRKSRR